MKIFNKDLRKYANPPAFNDNNKSSDSEEFSGKYEFKIKCHGRNEKGENALETPIEAKVTLTHWLDPSEETTLTMNVACRYNTGGHGQRCKASHPDIDKVGDGIDCPFAADMPYVIDELIKIFNKYESNK